MSLDLDVAWRPTTADVSESVRVVSSVSVGSWKVVGEGKYGMIVSSG